MIFILTDSVGTGSKPVHFINKPAQINRAGLEPAPTKPIHTFILSAKRQPLYEIVRQFKTFSATRINELRQTTGDSPLERGVPKGRGVFPLERGAGEVADTSAH